MNVTALHRKLYIICEYSIAFFCNVPLSHSDAESVCDETVNQIRRKQACKTVIEINLFVESAVYERSPSDVPSVTETKTLNWRVKTESKFFFTPLQKIQDTACLRRRCKDSRTSKITVLCMNCSVA